MSVNSYRAMETRKTFLGCGVAPFKLHLLCIYCPSISRGADCGRTFNSEAEAVRRRNKGMDHDRQGEVKSFLTSHSEPFGGRSFAKVPSRQIGHLGSFWGSVGDESQIKQSSRVKQKGKPNRKNSIHPLYQLHLFRF